MAGARIVWTPLGETGTEYVDLTTFGLQRLAGGEESDAELTPTPAGRAVVLWHDSWEAYEVHVDGIHRTEDSLAFLQLHSFLAHARAGAAFEFRIDNAKTYSATLTANAARGATTLTVASTTGLSSGDTIQLEHVSDPRRQMTTISGTPTGTTFSISPALHHALPIGSKVQHFQYLKFCRVLGGDVTFTERDAGLGAHLWDFRARFRTFRA